MGPKVRLHHFAMSVGNLQESIAWYQEMFDLKVISTMTIEHTGAHIAFVGNENFLIEMLEIPNAKPLPAERNHPDTDNSTLGMKHYCIIVDNNIEFIENLKAKGVQIVFEFQPGGEESYAAFINDPTGNVIEVFDSRNMVAGER